MERAHWMVVEVDGRIKIGRDKVDLEFLCWFKTWRKSDNLVDFATVMFCDDNAHADRWWRRWRGWFSSLVWMSISLEQCWRGCV